MKSLKKGIKGQLILPATEQCFKYINENIEVFKGVCASRFNKCLFDIYEATYNDDEVVGIDFDILDNTKKECEASYKIFKEEIESHFGFKPKEIFIGRYDKI